MVGKQAYDILMGFRVNRYFWIFELGIAGFFWGKKSVHGTVVNFIGCVYAMEDIMN